ncbi:membrane protein insertase YidC [Oceanihabitans sediminis]|uniref:Membrane protein insertase YidC n=1 Tax=Oceanihabitans sediminis TaxID=1812012 RepID=A0A368P4D3_9FLAO|nr:membrane protein insertase YidC [Oceanihabitans sediminis]MDX1278123.1 membrane protein insertase YidC [Oceanihabitans sediminis]MDX1774398.1 membrane protein insertase YidC [Oceanihabitans sediminis]RBP29799.1 protein translocase subunit yidC [Oceanihabitans sediminis]RCU57140.1 membrane protein insertase YidC [Oceanihabitans sediminis]
MEEKKLDLNSIIGFILIFGILVYMMYMNQPTPEELAEQERAKQEQVEAEKKANKQEETLVTSAVDYSAATISDSLQLIALNNKLGAFAYSSTLPSATDKETLVENDLLALKFSNKGGYLSEVRLKSFVDYDSIPIYLIKDGNAAFNISFNTTDNRNLNTQDLFFEPTISKNGENTVVSMKLKVSPTQFLEYRYELKPNDYMIDFSINSQGLSTVLNSSQEINLDWKLKTFRHDKSISYENRYTRLTYQYEGDKLDKLSPTSDDDEMIEDASWISYRQHFFSSILVADQPIKSVQLTSKNLVEDEEIDTVFTKQYASKFALNIHAGEINQPLKYYFGPTDHKTLKQYDIGLEDSIPFGWGIFGWINRYLFVPLFSMLSSFLPYGVAIVVMTILIKLLLSFVQYKQFLSQAKLKIIKPELDAIKEKYKDNKMKIQQETMALQTKVGASPLSGCLPALIQLPVFYALFQFFPSAFDLRQKSFLWADDLSSYDTVAELPFHIPFYGDHVSLFPILASIAIFFYMKMTTGQQMASQPTQEGMPDMQKMMKYMIYFSPIMMLFFFNNYASGLSLYYFISNVISIGIMIVIKNFILDEEKIHAKIQLNKKKPKKESRFQRKMAEMMEQAEKQKQAQKRK